MLGKSVYKSFLELNWLEIERKESNPSQFWHRIRDHANRAINELILLANKLPDEKQEQIFNYVNMKELIESVLTKTDDHTIPDEELSDVRRTQLAALLVEEGVKVCIKKYKSLFSETPTLAEPIIDQLNKAKGICRDSIYSRPKSAKKCCRQRELNIFV